MLLSDASNAITIALASRVVLGRNGIVCYATSSSTFSAFTFNLDNLNIAAFLLFYSTQSQK